MKSVTLMDQRDQLSFELALSLPNPSLMKPSQRGELTIYSLQPGVPQAESSKQHSLAPGPLLGQTTQRFSNTALYGTYSEGVARTAVAKTTSRVVMNFIVIELGGF